jgi:hypothetical protein
VRAANITRPAISEKAITSDNGAPPPRDTESFAIVSGGWKLIQNTRRPVGAPEFELFDRRRDMLDARDVAAAHPEMVARLAREIASWKTLAEGARLKPDAEATSTLRPEEMERLRALGYVQ